MRKTYHLLVASMLLTLGCAEAGDSQSSTYLKFIFGDQEFVSKTLSFCEIEPGGVFVNLEPKNSPVDFNVIFRDLGDEVGVMFGLIYELDGVTRKEDWNADGDMISSSALGRQNRHRRGQAATQPGQDNGRRSLETAS